MKKHLVIVGLGLIGGSMALALKGFEDFETRPWLRMSSSRMLYSMESSKYRLVTR